MKITGHSTVEHFVTLKNSVTGEEYDLNYISYYLYDEKCNEAFCDEVFITKGNECMKKKIWCYVVMEPSMKKSLDDALETLLYEELSTIFGCPIYR